MGRKKSRSGSDSGSSGSCAGVRSRADLALLLRLDQDVPRTGPDPLRPSHVPELEVPHDQEDEDGHVVDLEGADRRREDALCPRLPSRCGGGSFVRRDGVGARGTRGHREREKKAHKEEAVYSRGPHASPWVCVVGAGRQGYVCVSVCVCVCVHMCVSGFRCNKKQAHPTREPCSP